MVRARIWEGHALYGGVLWCDGGSGICIQPDKETP